MQRRILWLAGILLLKCGVASNSGSMTAIGNSDSSASGAEQPRILVGTHDLRWQGQSPPAEMPPELEWAFTRNGSIPTARMFVDDTWSGKGSHYIFKRADIDYKIEHARKLRRFGGGGKDEWLFQALRQFRIKKKTVLVYGSMDPWYESICIAFGARRGDAIRLWAPAESKVLALTVITVEYNKLTYEHPAIVTVKPSELADYLRKESVVPQAALSISSFDHDGLGRYGDPICPDGDLLAMDAVRDILAPGGVLFLTVPVGADLLVWNLHRRYGPLRLPLLLHGWEQAARFGWDEDKLTEDGNFRKSYEPVFVLRKPGDETSRSNVEPTAATATDSNTPSAQDARIPVSPSVDSAAETAKGADDSRTSRPPAHSEL